uniref:Pericentrin isoform X2 n=1 Tax=Geotrypetes seraphini TaxID=260995 RepID=A0A6P8RDP4_GEOSA|nr:pericentrin isoform X2 [Geotrypetes seraphini]
MEVQTRLAQQAELLQLQHNQKMLLCKDQLENMEEIKVMVGDLKSVHKNPPITKQHKRNLKEQIWRTPSNQKRWHHPERLGDPSNKKEEYSQTNPQSEKLRLKYKYPSCEAEISNEQTVDWEHEREDFQEKIQNLEIQLKRMGKLHSDAIGYDTKDLSIADLQTHIENFSIQMKQLQETLLRQEEELSSKANLRDPRKHVNNAEDFAKNVSQATDKPKSFIENLIKLSPWGSPELVRKQDINMEHIYNFQETLPFSEGSIALEALPAKFLALEEDKLQGYVGSFINGIQCSKDGQDFGNFSLSGNTYSIAESQDAEKIHLEDQALSSLPVAACDYGSYTISDLGRSLSQAVESKHLHAQFLTYLQLPEMDEDGAESANGMAITELEKLSPVLQAMLDMVHEESCNILACSERPFICKMTPVNSQHSTGLESWQQERHNLLGIINTLKEFLIKVIDKRHKDAEDTSCDWKGEILHNVQGLFEKEHVSLHSELLPHFHDHSSGDRGSLIEKLEHIVKEQEGQQQLGLEYILSFDRSSLLGEIQDLRAQLRMTQLQNREKLQELQESITSAEEHGSKREHQLRKQVELLEYKLQQEMSMVNDLQCSLSCQQEKLAEQFQHLKEEQTTTSNLQDELWHNKQEVERLLSSHQALQHEISRLSYTLKSKEQDLVAAVQSFQREHEKRKEWIEQDQHQTQQEDQKGNTVKDLKATLEEKKSLNKQLSIALESEQASNSNLRKELQIEYSRCEALLSHERSKLSDFQYILTLERQRSKDLAATINYERTVLEQLTKKHQEQNSFKDQGTLMEQSFVQELQAQLMEERKHIAELADIMEKTQQQTALAKRQAEFELQKSHDETQKEREFRKKLQSALELLQRDRETQLLIMREEQQEGNDREKVWARDQAMLVQRLYMKYLRAESYRKALVYQKKYLLLLLGGFQDCEQATLSLIARMGVYPSPTDLQVSAKHSHAFTRFRSVVRTIIAIARLCFLVKKWHRLNKKEGQNETIIQNTPVSVGARSKIPGQWHQLSSNILNSPPTQNTSSSHEIGSAHVSSSAKATHNWFPLSSSISSESSLACTQDPEYSLTEYIQHLEIIQKRLGDIQQGEKMPGSETFLDSQTSSASSGYI